MPVSNSIDNRHLKHVDEINFSHFDLQKLAGKMEKWAVLQSLFTAQTVSKTIWTST
jgi:hypothetical protein